MDHPDDLRRILEPLPGERGWREREDDDDDDDDAPRVGDERWDAGAARVWDKGEAYHTARHIQCPYCWAVVEVALDPTDVGEQVQDCEVCCRPWTLRIAQGAGGMLEVEVRRAQ